MSWLKFSKKFFSIIGVSLSGSTVMNIGCIYFIRSLFFEKKLDNFKISNGQTSGQNV